MITNFVYVELTNERLVCVWKPTANFRMSREACVDWTYAKAIHLIFDIQQVIFLYANRGDGSYLWMLLEHKSYARLLEHIK